MGWPGSRSRVRFSGGILRPRNRLGERDFVGVLDEVGELEENAGFDQTEVGSVKIGGAGEAMDGADVVVEGIDEVKEVGLGAIGGGGVGDGGIGDGLEILNGDEG